jgi:transcriptional regulator with AAA-type ATPase domain
MQKVQARIDMIAHSEAAVLISGESGTGKELVALMLHERGPRAEKPFVAVNCAAFPDTLIEAELFGFEKGAFTGAMKKRDGRFRAADGGTLFLDEIAELPLPAQAKLLRVLQDGTFEPVGADETVKVDVRVVSATHRDLREQVEKGCSSSSSSARTGGPRRAPAPTPRRASRARPTRPLPPTRSRATCASTRTPSSTPSCSRVRARSPSSTCRVPSRSTGRSPASRGR